MKKIDANGIYSGLPLAQYHGQPAVGPSISSSGLRTIFQQSPAHYYVHSPLNPNRVEPKESPSFVRGRAAHHLLLSEDHFSTLFIVRPERYDSYRTKEARQWKSDQEAMGRTCLLPSDIEAIRGMAHALAENPLVQNGILSGQIEQTMAFKDEKTGVYCLSRPDAVPNDSGDFADLKGSSDSGDDLDRAVGKWRYDCQAAVTKMAYQAIFKRQMTSFSFVFCEFERPHCVDILTLTSEDIELAEQDMRVALDTFAWCLANDNWFGPSGHQSDARFVHISDRVKERAEWRRDFLRREIGA